MKIALVNWQDPAHPYAGGAEYYLWEYFSRLADRHEIHWFGARAKGMPRVERGQDGITYHRMGPWHIANFTVPLLYSRWRRHHRPDVVVDSITKVPTFLPLWERAVPVVTFVPHLFGETAFQETNPLLASYVVMMERPIPWIYRKTPFIAISESTRQDLIHRGIPPENIHLFLPGVDTGRYVPGAKSPKPLVVYLGRMKRYKRVDLALQAFAKVSESMPDAHMVVVGGGDYLEPLKDIARKLGLDRRVTFTGLVPQEEKIRYLQQAWVLVNTSPKEGWGMVNTEAQACGTPVVAFDAPGIRDSVRHGETGFLVPYGNVEALARAILRVLQDRELREHLGTKARAFAESLSWDRFAAELEIFFERLVNRGPQVTSQENPREAKP